MKTLLMLLGSGLIAFAIGCGDEGSTNKPQAVTPTTTPGGMDPEKMKEMMEAKMPKGAGATAEATDATDAAKDDTKDAPKDDAAKEGDATKDAPKTEDKKEEDKKEEDK